MRKDILETVVTIKMNDIKPNYSKIARQYQCDPRTVKRYYEKGASALVRNPRKIKLILDPYKDIIINKLQIGASARAIHLFLRTKGIKCGYSTVKNFCRTYHVEKQKQAIIRFETNPGLQAQVDWKENVHLHSKYGEIFRINIFLIVLGYSRYKYIELTIDKDQRTVFKCLCNAFKYFKGVPKEILFDNMRTVVDRSRTQFNKPVYNTKFYEFSKNLNFIPKSCLAYTPKTKGKVESVARLMNRLLVYDGEFETLEQLKEIVRGFNKQINQEKSQATGQVPLNLFEKEYKELNSLPNQDILEEYQSSHPNKRKVSSESMICVGGIKYSVPPQYIKREVFYQLKGNTIEIYDDNHRIICTHPISKRKLNYSAEHYHQIVSMVVENKDTIEKICEANLTLYDQI